MVDFGLSWQRESLPQKDEQQTGYFRFLPLFSTLQIHPGDALLYALV